MIAVRGCVKHFLVFVASLVDTTRAFVRKGKLKPLKLLQKHSSFISTFQYTRKCSDLSSEETLKRLERFTCLVHGGRLSDINLMRYAEFKDWLTFRMETSCYPATVESGYEPAASTMS